jgi:hypothetical protein
VGYVGMWGMWGMRVCGYEGMWVCGAEDRKQHPSVTVIVFMFATPQRGGVPILLGRFRI